MATKRALRKPAPPREPPSQKIRAAQRINCLEIEMRPLIQGLLLQEAEEDTKKRDSISAYRSEWIRFSEWMENEIRMDWQITQIPSCLLKKDRLLGDCRNHYKIVDDILYCRDVVFVDSRLRLLQRRVDHIHANVPLEAASWRQHDGKVMCESMRACTAPIIKGGFNSLELRAARALWQSPAAAVLLALRSLQTSVRTLRYTSHATTVILNALATSEGTFPRST